MRGIARLCIAVVGCLRVHLIGPRAGDDGPAASKPVPPPPAPPHPSQQRLCSRPWSTVEADWRDFSDVLRKLTNVWPTNGYTVR